MPFATIDGLKVNYHVQGSGPHLLMLAPGGFNSTIGSWTRGGVWKEPDFLGATQKKLEHVEATVPVGESPMRLALQPGEQVLWVAGDAASGKPGTVTAIDVATRQVLATIPIGKGHQIGRAHV